MGCTSGKVADKSASAAAQRNEAKAAVVKPAEGTFTVTLERKTDSEEAGIELERANEKVLRITLVKEEGLLVDWNAKQEADSDKRIKVGDRIVAVNDESGNAEKMLQAFKQVGRLTLTAQRIVVAAEEPTAVPEPQSADGEVSAQDASEAEASYSEKPRVQEITADNSGEAAATQQSQGRDTIVEADDEDGREVANADGVAAEAAKLAENPEHGKQPENQPAGTIVAECSTAKQKQRAPEDALGSVVVEPEATDGREVANAEGAAAEAAKLAENPEHGKQPENQPAGTIVAECSTAKQKQRAPEDALGSVVVKPEATEANAGLTKTCGCF